jgi:predicted dehydrogenase|tara:strand:+ start:640 stop:1689 length:1050 start_codon:yes stop_codon:yes gene_type:complete
MGDLNIGIVGFGLVGKRHASALEKTNGLLLKDVIEHDPTSLQSSEKELKFITHNDLDEYLNSNKPDGLIIATPTVLHIDQAMKCIEKKIPLLIEKPISVHAKDAITLIKRSKELDVPLLIGQHRRHNQIIKTTKKILDEGVLGEIRSIQATCWFYKPDHYFDAAPWRKLKGAGPIYVNLIHDVDLLRYFCGEVKTVYANAIRSTRGYDNEDVASAVLTFKNDIIANVSVSDSISSPWSWETTSNEHPVYPNTNNSCYLIGGAEGSLSLPDLKLWKHEKKPDWWTPLITEKYDFQNIDPLITQLENFRDVILGKTEPLVSGLEGVRSLQVIEAIQSSIASKSPIDISNLT